MGDLDGTTTSRRRLLIGGTAVAGAAWVTPAMSSIEVAGAGGGSGPGCYRAEWEDTNAPATQVFTRNDCSGSNCNGAGCIDTNFWNNTPDYLPTTAMTQETDVGFGCLTGTTFYRFDLVGRLNCVFAPFPDQQEVIDEQGEVPCFGEDWAFAAGRRDQANLCYFAIRFNGGRSIAFPTTPPFSGSQYYDRFKILLSCDGVDCTA